MLGYDKRLRPNYKGQPPTRLVLHCLPKILAIRKSAGSYRTLMLFSNRVDCLCDRWFNNFNAAIKLITQFSRIKTVNRAIEV